jgi:DNA-binding response OmpR family regulator
MSSKILIVEDDHNIVELLTYNLEQEGYDVHVALDGADALQRAAADAPDLIILDLLLPEIDGLEVCRLLKRNRQTAAIPVIMLTAKSEEIDRIVGFELGADDYIAKPFSPREVVLRVRAVLRRMTSRTNEPSNQIEVHGLTINLDKHLVRSAEGEIDLTATELKMLTLFAQAPGRVFTRSVLMDVIWGQEYYGVDRTVDTHVSRLRRKLGRFGENIETVHGVGYRFTG